MSPASQVYDMSSTATALQCTVRGRITLPGVVMELHDYHFTGRQSGVLSPSRNFLDLALSPRPRNAWGEYDGYQGRGLGEIFFVPAGNSLNTQWGEGEQMSICCGFDALELGGGTAISEAALQSALDVRSSVLHDALRRISEEMVHPGFCSELLVEAIWGQAAIELQRYLRRSDAHADVGSATLTRRQLQDVIERIEQPGKPPRVTEMAAACGLSTRHFFRQFQIATGQTPASFVAERKIELAKTRLRQARTAVKVIAWECGFDSAAAFSASFRRVTGVTPRQFRGE